ncbi:MAG: transposase [Candidatus Poribacteria bacterium]|nr:transposase [Candidatus Poribacteria bacterium]
MALKAHKIALRATEKQRSWFAQQCGYARVAFNYGLSDFKDGLSKDEWRSARTLRKRFNAEKREKFEWSGACDQRAAAYAFENLGDAITRWKKGENGFPKYKKRSHRQSYTVEGAKVKVADKHIRLPKIGRIRMFEALRFEGDIRSVTISRTAHRWFVSILVDTGTPKPPCDTRGLPVVGIDVGINTLATLDDGTKYHNPRPLNRYERKLKREQRKLSKKVFRSNNWQKQKRKVERIHYRIACIRADAHHKATTDIVKRASGIGIETLKITNMLKNRNLAKALSDSALGGFLEKLKSKAKVLGIPIIAAPQFFASSQTCSRCGHKKTDLSLSERQYHCQRCGFREDRDVNAALNLRPLAVGSAER